MAEGTAERPRIGLDPVLRVGVTGHRNLADEAAVRAAAAAVFAELAAQLERLSPSLPSPARLRVVSPLADGADRIVAEAGLAVGGALHCPLPFARATYEDDFGDASTADFRVLLDRAERVFELNGRREDPEGAYEAVGRVVMGHADFLVAVWNGAPPQGRGGTGQIVEEALSKNIPVIWIDPAGDRPPMALIPGHAAHHPAPLSALEPAAAEILAGPRSAEDEGTTLAVFASERRPSWTFGGLFTLFRNLVLGRPSAPPVRIGDWHAAAERRWREELKDVPPPVSEPILTWLMPVATWADELATYYGGLYRSVFLANFLLSVLGSAIGLSTVFNGIWTGSNEIWNVGSTLGEIACAAAIIMLAMRARRRGWHGRWIDYRELAERLRPLRFIYLLGSGSRRQTFDPDHPAHRGAWIDWLVPDVERSLGMPDVAVTPSYLEAVRGFLLAEIDGQIGYHRTNAQRMATVEHRLGKVGEAMFWLVLGGGVLSLTLYFAPPFHLPWRPDTPVKELAGPLFMFLGVVLPALGAALFGIRALGEFSRLAKRSSGTADALIRHREALAGLSGVSLTRDAVCQAADTAAQLMMSETADWRTLVVMRPIDMPG